MKGCSPDNPKIRRVFFHPQDAYERGEKRHPQEVMRDLATAHRFKILAAVPQSIHDGWDFWIEEEGEPVSVRYLLVRRRNLLSVRRLAGLRRNQ